MVAGRRLSRARHEMRVGGRELMVIGMGLLLLCVGVFVGGLLVGRELAGGLAPPQVAGPARDPASLPAAGAAPSFPPSAEPRPAERLTFYRTLTSPTPDLPASAPIVEERLEPEPAPPPPPPVPPKAEKPEKRAAQGQAPATPRARPVPAAASPAPAAPSTASADPPVWTVQVSSFLSRTLAEELLARLQARGLDAYLVSTATGEGRVRHRVRVGAYASRADAERVMADLRAERTVAPFVTQRSR